MKRNLESNLGYIMRILNISGKELAGVIHVDVSLVSKWKTKKRKILKDAQYFTLMQEYIFRKSAETDHHILIKALSKFEYDLSSDAGIRQAIGDFVLKENLSMLNNPLNIVLPSDPSGTVYDYNFRVFKGNAGRRQAVIQFFEKILSYEEPTEVLVFSQEDMSWLLEDPIYTRNWLMKFREILDRGNKVKMIHFVDRSVSKISEMVAYWAQLYTHPNIESYYYARYFDTEYQVTMFIEDNRLGVYGNQIGEEMPESRYTAYFEDDYTIQMYKKLFDRYLSHSRPFIKNYTPEDYDQVIESFTPDGLSSRVSLLSPMPHSLLMSSDHLEEIVRRHGVSEDRVERLLTYQRYFQSRIAQGLQCAFSFKTLQQGFASGSMRHESLSRCLGTEIIFTQDDFIRLFEQMKKLTAREGCEIVILEEEGHIFDSKMNILVDHGRMVMSYSPFEMTHISVATESTTVRSFEIYFQDLWSRIPRLIKTAEDFEDKIRRITNGQI